MIALSYAIRKCGLFLATVMEETTLCGTERITQVLLSRSYRDAIRVFLVNMSFKNEEEHHEAKHVIFKVMSNRVQALLQMAQWKEVRLCDTAAATDATFAQYLTMSSYRGMQFSVQWARFTAHLTYIVPGSDGAAHDGQSCRRCQLGIVPLYGGAVRR